MTWLKWLLKVSAPLSPERAYWYSREVDPDDTDEPEDDDE